MKITRILLLATAVVVSACSKDDDAKSSSLEKASLSLSSESTVVSAPAGLSSSTDEHAVMANAWIAMANQVTTNYASLMKAPSGAQKLSTKITATNGRVKDSDDFVAWTWTDPKSHYTVGYQISEVSDSYVFEMFFKYSDNEPWLKFLHAEEKKDKSAGELDVYNIGSQDASEIVLAYEWSTVGDVFTFVMSSPLEDFDFTLTVNTKTKAGGVVYNMDGSKKYEMSWNAEGSGTWTLYDEEGAVAEEGNW